MTTAATIITNARNRVGISSTDGMATDAVMLEMVAAACRRVALMHDWPWLESSETLSTVIGTTEYTPGATWRTTTRVSIEGDDLEYRTPRDLADYLEMDGRPVLYTVERGKLVLAPNPDAVYSVNHQFIRQEVALATTADSPLVPDWAIDLPTTIVAHMLAARIKDSGLQRLIEAEITDLIRSLRDETRRARGYPKPKSRRDYIL